MGLVSVMQPQRAYFVVVWRHILPFFLGCLVLGGFEV